MDFEEIYEKYFKDVYLYLLGISSNKSIAEEITQDAFFKALKNIDSFDNKNDIRRWLFTIAKNTYYSYYKKNKRLIGDEQLESVPDNSVKIVENLENEEDAFEIHKFLHTMASPYKDVFNLRVFGELSFAKIGSIFGKSESWARVTFFRAKSKVAEYMEGKSIEKK